MELNPGADFDLYINGALCGHYTGMGWNLTAKSWYLNSSCFSGGRNTININFTENESNFIGGGYISVHYRTGEWNRIPDLNTYWFPGIKGLINLYSGFYVPGDIQDMNVHLHYRHNISNVSTYLTIANVTVYRSDVTGERNIFLDWSNLSASFGGDLALANAVSKKTVPIKFGTEEFAFQGGAGIADIVFVIDSTGSMCGEIAMVHNTASDFADVLATKGIDFRLGIMEHKDWPINPCGKTTDFPYLWRGFTSNVTEFKKRVNNIGCGGGADLPESYLDALNQTRSVPWRPNAIRTNIMMGDDRPHDSDCGTSQPCAGVLDSMTDEVITWLADDNITTHVINYAGMCKMEDIANGTGGNFYDYSVASDIKDILLEIAEVIANVSLQAQMINITGNVSMDNILYPDSYIKFDTSAPPMLKHGETLLTLESLPFGNNISNGTFFVPNKTRPIDAKVTSYSGPYWTNFLKINSSNTGGWKEVYNLTDYGSNYKTLGDPYIVNIPIEKVGTGTNFVEIRTGESPSIDTGGSPDNRVIYSVAMRTFTGYSKPKKSTEGCNWTIEFFDGTTENLLVPSEYTGPKNCNYTNTSIIYDNQSSVDVVTYRLFSQLDTTPRDGRLDVKLNSKDIAIETTTVGGVRSLWGPIRVKLILWT
ncbi:MAG: hypothetical protein DRJ03_30300 [Chloroflexi bacterium]|nr:MAG: hypothetical protein DRJ03_30300 [Chloroflexota bacterium]